MIKNQTYAVLVFFLITAISCIEKSESSIGRSNLFPWCIVAYDSLDRTPEERIALLNKLGFKKYAYDWRDNHLDDMARELSLAQENGIEIISVWLWLNAKRDSIGKLSESNERIFNTLEDIDLKTTLWLGLSPNFFEGQTQDESIREAKSFVAFINKKAAAIGCKVALYGHSGWFRDVKNQIKIIKALPQYEMSMVYNFHHAQPDLDDFPETAKMMTPYLSAVNLNGVSRDGPKILAIGKGDHEKRMIKLIIEQGFEGPWGILGHIANEDAGVVLQRNLSGLNQAF